MLSVCSKRPPAVDTYIKEIAFIDSLYLEEESTANIHGGFVKTYEKQLLMQSQKGNVQKS